MRYEVGDLLEYEIHRDSSIRFEETKIVYGIVLESEKHSGVVYWFQGAGRSFAQSIEWNNFFGTFRKLS